jgi:phosphoribosylformimino-5-aminoimidazole carboxamide ribotide isomerase
MIIFPAIDLHNGTCVRLLKGDFATVEKVAENPIETAELFKRAGAKWLHMVDLNGAKTGVRINREVIINVAKSTTLNIELGGGIRDMASIEDYLNNGIKRIILGSAALKNPSFVRIAVKEYGEKIAIGIDANNGLVATEGWLDNSNVSYLDFAKQMENIGVKYVIFTDIACDGTLAGPNFEQLEAMQNAISCKIIASGGIRDIDNIKKLTIMNLYGAICGRSLYSGTLDLNEAIMQGGYTNAC